MGTFETSLMVGLMLGILSMWLVNFINDWYTRQERKLSLLLLKRAKRD